MTQLDTVKALVKTNMACMCGDSECRSCGCVQGTRQQDRRLRVASGTMATLQRLRDMHGDNATLLDVYSDTKTQQPLRKQLE